MRSLIIFVKSDKQIIQSFLRKAGLESAWEMHIYPDKLPVKKRKENTDTPPPKPEVLKEEGVYLVIGVFRDLSNAHRHKKRFLDFAPKVITAKSKNIAWIISHLVEVDLPKVPSAIHSSRNAIYRI